MVILLCKWMRNSFIVEEQHRIIWFVSLSVINTIAEMSMIHFVLVDEALENKVMETENMKMSGISAGYGYTL